MKAVTNIPNQEYAIIRSTLALLMGVIIVLSPNMATAQSTDTPYWASIDEDEARTRTGPNTEYKILWVYQRKNLPVKVLKRYGVWRHIEDPDGDKGWMHVKLLSPRRTAMVTSETRPMRTAPRANAKVAWRLEPGVVGRLGECTENGWCSFEVDERTGFVQAAHLFGAGAP